MKTPLKDPFNFKCTKTIKELIPKGSSVESFLLFSAKIESSLSTHGCSITSHTNRPTVHNFWSCANNDPQRVAEQAEYFSKMLLPHRVFPNDKLFHLLQEKWDSYSDPYVQAALFFLLNQTSEKGLISSGKFKLEDFNAVTLLNMRRFSAEKFNIILDAQQNVVETFGKTKKNTDYLLFPVGIHQLSLLETTSHNGSEIVSINHNTLQEYLMSEKKKWVAVYKFVPRLLDIYKDFNMIVVDKYGRKTYNKKTGEDFVVCNF